MKSIPDDPIIQFRWVMNRLIPQVNKAMGDMSDEELSWHEEARAREPEIRAEIIAMMPEIRKVADFLDWNRWSEETRRGGPPVACEVITRGLFRAQTELTKPLCLRINCFGSIDLCVEVDHHHEIPIAQVIFMPRRTKAGATS